MTQVSGERKHMEEEKGKGRGKKRAYTKRLCIPAALCLPSQVDIWAAP